MLGRLSDEPSSDCEPFRYADDGNNIPIAPCGAIANSLFNDSMKIIMKKNSQEVPLLRTGIAWPSDTQIKFRNPEGDLKDSKSIFFKNKENKLKLIFVPSFT